MAQRLLFVDSDRRFLQDHQVALESVFDVDFCHSTDGVAQRLETGQYAAVLICVEVSENKGYALCSAIRKNPLLSALKVALISAKATEEEYGRHQSLKGRADLYLHKPIDSSSLVAELTPLVPLRGVDPDNPLGDLGADLGEEWLESLKTELDTEETILAPEPPLPPLPVALPRSTAPLVPGRPTIAIPLPSMLPSVPQIAKDAGKMELLESRVRDLEAKLQEQDGLLARQDQELEGLRSEQERATRNLDEAELCKAELTGLRQELEGLRSEHERTTRNLDEAELCKAELNGLQQELADLRSEHERTARSLEDAERGMAERDELQQKLKDAEEALLAQEILARESANQASHIQEKLEDTEKERDELRGRAEELGRGLTEQEEGRISAEHRSAELAEEIAHLREREAASEAAAERILDLEGQANGFEARIQELQNQLETRIAELAERAKEGDALKVDIAGLEATLRGQRRELADQGGRLGGLTRECETLQAKLTEHEARRLELEATLLDRESQLQTLGAEVSELRELRQSLEARLFASEKAMAQAVVTHEKLQMELMQGIDEREAHLNRLNAGIDAQRERIASLDAEKRELEGYLNEKAARLEALSEAVADLETGIRRASDLTRPV